MGAQQRLEGEAADAAVPVEGGAVPRRDWTFYDVQDRLVEAMLTCWRLPDRERAWSRGASDGPWHLVMPDAAYDGGRGAGEARVEGALRSAAMTRADVAEMDEAFGWVEALSGGERRLVGAVIAELARGRREVSWVRIGRRFGVTRGLDGLRMRYSRAIASIAARLNGGNPRANVSMG